jgi:peptidoglycan/xylan/chitin deacetylase (PgdA/CDA1 family)
MLIRDRWLSTCLTAAVLVIWASCAGCDLFPWLSPPPHTHTGIKVNLQVDAENTDTAGLTRIINELKARGIHTTIYVTADYVNGGNALMIQGFYGDGFEIALHGFHTGEQLATMTYDEQLDLLTRAKSAVEGCHPCGLYKPVTGFRPQYFSQNEDTYKALQTLNIGYNSGFKAGLLVMPGHEADYAPYQATGEGYDFKAVPITTVPFADKTIYLCDIGCATGENMTAEQWSQALQTGVDQCTQDGQPLVVLLHGWYTGDTTQYTYWQPLIDLLDRLEAEDADFISTSELVEAYASSGSGG